MRLRGWWLALLPAWCLSGPVLAQQCSPAELQVDVRNCGTCGNDCTANSLNANFACNSGQCVNLGCRAGFYDLNSDGRCEYACTFRSAVEQCNGLDDDCDGQIDEDVPTPTTQAVCGVSPIATGAECNAQVQRTCVSGAWQCAFPSGVCLGGNCASTAEICDNVDNNCNGLLNENVANYGKACASDDGLAPPGHGRCRTQGTFVCNGANATVCNAVQASCALLPGGCTEQCDGIDNDCDQLIDEPFTARGLNAAFFVKPAVTRVGTNLWMFQYEASRPGATLTTPGQGNGYFTTAPAGATYDRTRACSAPGVMPWTDVTPPEVEQACAAMGGRVCTQLEYQTTCSATVPCIWGYAPRGASCTSGYTSTKFCNLAISYDSDVGTPGDQDAVLPTGSSALLNCYADWNGLQGNAGAGGRLYDITGNLREVTKVAANSYIQVGGSMLSNVESGAICAKNDFLTDGGFRYRDAGFRCCFDADPTQ